MNPSQTAAIPGRRLAWIGVVNIGVSCLVAVVLVFLRISDDFLDTLKICVAVGSSIWGVVMGLRLLSRGRMPTWAVVALAIPAGLIIGSKLAALAGATDLVQIIVRNPLTRWRTLANNLLIATVATLLMVFYYRAQELRMDLLNEQRRAAEALQSETAARLALLQAQIEPHFLFNTLANVQSAITTDPDAARAMLEHFNRYLRVSLGRTRHLVSTLADELELVQALLAIAAMRLGARLQFTISVPQELRGVRLPPLLLQPLVENALEHGIEPSMQGGEVRIDARGEGDALLLRVSDTGVGLDPACPEGVGLANVRARLRAVYGERARLAFFANSPQGVIAELLLPRTAGGGS